MTYSNLSNYLLNSINEAEAGGGRLKQKSGNGWFACVTAFLGWTGSSENTASNNKVTELLAKQRAEAKKKAKDRLKKLKDSREAAYIKKLEARYANKERQLDLINDQKIRRFKAAEKRLEAAKKMAESSNTIRTPEQNEAFYERLDREFREGQGLPDNAQHIQDLAKLIIFNDEGVARTEEELKAWKNSDDGKKIMAQFSEAANDPAITEKGLETLKNDPNFSNFYEEITEEAQKKTDIEQNLSDAKEIKEKYEKRVNAAKAYNGLKTKHDEAKKAYDNTDPANPGAKQKLEAITGEFALSSSGANDDKPFILDESNGTVSLSSDFNLGKYIANDLKSFVESDDYKNAEDKDAKLNEFKTRYGLPSDLDLTGINNLETDNGLANALATIESKINGSTETAESGLDDDVKENIKNTILENKQATYNSAKQKVDEAKAEMDKHPDPDTYDFETNTLNLDADVINNVKEYNKLGEEDKKSVQTDLSSEDKKLNADGKLKSLQEAVDAAEKAKAKSEEVAAARAEEIKAAKKNIASSAVAVKLQDKVNKLVGQANDGESVKTIDGKQVQGFYSETEKDEKGKPKFIQRPEDESSEEFKKYQSELTQKLLTGNYESAAYEGSVIEKDGKYYLSTPGKEDEPIEEDMAVEILANQEEVARNKKLQQNAKIEAVDTAKEFLKNPAKFAKNIKDDPAFKEKLLTVLRDPESVCKGTDMEGNKTMQEMKDALGSLDIKKIDELDLPEELKKEIKSNYYDKDEDKLAGIDDEGYEDIENSKDEDDPDEDEIDDTEGEAEEGDDEKLDKEERDGENGEKVKKLINPKKIWKRKKNKRTGKPTENYYNKEGEGIPEDEFKEKMARYKARVAKKKNKPAKHATQQSNNTVVTEPAQTTPANDKRSRYEDFKNYLFERFGN